MHPDLEKLIALQQADAEIARLRDEIALLPRRVSAIEAKLAGTQTPRGWGLFLIEQMVDEVKTARENGHHIVELVMNREGDGHGS